MDEEGWVMYHGCGPVLRVVGACGGLGQGLDRGSRGSRLFSDHCLASKFLLEGGRSPKVVREEVWEGSGGRSWGGSWRRLWVWGGVLGALWRVLGWVLKGLGVLCRYT